MSADKALRCTWCGGELRVDYPQGENDDTVTSIGCWDCSAEWSSEGKPWRNDRGEWPI